MASRLLLLLLLILIQSPGLHAQFAHFNTKRADSIAALYPAHSLQNLRELSLKLTEPFDTEQEKFRAIYRWVSQNIENDYFFYALNKRNRERWEDSNEKLERWDNDFRKRVFSKLLKEHKTICTGYAYLIKELSYHAGIEAVIVDGYGRTAEANIGGKGQLNHSWNAVKLNNKWYLCDATWSAGRVNTHEKSFIKEFNETYFLTPPEFFIRNHYPLDPAWSLLDNTPTLNEFLNRPMIYPEAIAEQVIPISPELFNLTVQKGEKVQFQFHGPEDLNAEARIQLVMGKHLTESKASLTHHAENRYSLEYSFKRRGIFTMHILLDNNYVFSYDVRVE